MTSRVRRIVLAMYGHGKPVMENRIVSSSCPTVAGLAMTDSSVYWMGTHGCYEAMDDFDDVGLVGVVASASLRSLTDSTFYEEAGAPPRVLVGGNYGLPCA